LTIRRIGLVALVSFLFCVSALTFQPVEGTTCLASYNDSLSVRSVNVAVRVYDLNLETRYAKVHLFANINFDFNSTYEQIICHVYSVYDLYVAQLELAKRGTSYYEIKDEMKDKDWDISFRGGPEVYPFDRYEFNVTFAFCVLLDNTTLPIDPRSVMVSLGFPAMFQWDGPLDTGAQSEKRYDWPSVSVTFAVQRPQWEAYAIITPILFILFLVGFSAFLDTNREEVGYRFLMYIVALLTTIGYFTLIQNALPAGRHYLSTPEASMYGVLGASIFFFAFSLVSYKTGVNRVVCDSIAIALSIAFVSFIILTFYLNPHIFLTMYTFEKFLLLEWAFSAILLIGLVAYSVHYTLNIVKGKSLLQVWMSLKRLQERTLDNVIRAAYGIGFALNLICLLVTVYVVSLFGPSVEITPGRRFLFELVHHDLGLMILTQLSLTVLCIFIAYYVLRAKGFFFISDFFGIMLLAVSIPNYINDLVLFPYPQQPMLFIVFIALGLVIGFLFSRKRLSYQRMREMGVRVDESDL